METIKTINITVPVLARVEGEGALELSIRQGRIETLKLDIFEPPRLFEKFLEGRDYSEVPDMVARICGICPVAYQMSAVQAIESIFGFEPTPWIRAMRRVLYCGEWIQSHALHIHLLAIPDILGYDSVVSMAADHAELVRRGLRLQGTGNRIMRLLGGRSVHPVGVRVGGFHHAPRMSEVDEVKKMLQTAVTDAKELLAWTARLNFPDDRQDFIHVALRHSGEYPMNEGRLVSDRGLDIAIEQYQDYFREYQVPHSTALHSCLYPHGIASQEQGNPYLVGPLARINLNQDQLPETARTIINDAGLYFPSRNMFHSLVARAAEIYYAVLEAQRLLEDYRESDTPWMPVVTRPGTGYGCTEAPRGSLWHRFEIDEQGHIISARIVPPTSQNQARIEQDLYSSLTSYGLDHSDTELRARSEMVIRNYDPCISCATHFLRLNVIRQ